MFRLPCKDLARFGVAVGWLCSVAAGLVSAAETLPLAEKVDRFFARYEGREGPGVIVGVALNGQTVHARGYGMANLEHAIPLAADTVSESGSVAKQFTAAAVVLLAVRGQLSLDDPIRKYLPEMGAVADPITVRMLLNHTSGLRDIHGIFDLIGRPSYSSMHTNDEVLRVMSRQRQLNFAPGTEYVYCNASYILAALIVERVSKTSFNTFCTEHLFRPRGLTHTRWRDDFTAVVPGRATGYAARAAGGHRIDLPYSNLVGNGGLLTTVGDLLAWTLSFDGATGEWAEVVRQLQTPSRLSDGRALTYGLGIGVDTYAGVMEISHGGATSGFRTYLTCFPSKGLAIALLSNSAEFVPTPVARSVARAVIDLPTEARPKRVSLGAAEIAGYAGLYHSAKTDALLSLEARGERLMLNNGELIPTGPETFTTAGGQTTYVFAKPAAGEARTLTVTSDNATATFAARPRVKPTARELGAFEGEYWSEELEVSYTVQVRGDRLTMTRWPGTPVAGEPTFTGGFWFRDWHVTFTRDASGAVRGAELTNSSGRCRRVMFVRR